MKSSRNAFRHGLSLPLWLDPASSERTGAIAQLVTPNHADEEQRTAASELAQAQVDLLRIRAVRAKLMTELDLTTANLEQLRRLKALDRYERLAATKRRSVSSKLTGQDIGEVTRSGQDRVRQNEPNSKVLPKTGVALPQCANVPQTEGIREVEEDYERQQDSVSTSVFCQNKPNVSFRPKVKWPGPDERLATQASERVAKFKGHKGQDHEHRQDWVQRRQLLFLSERTQL